MGTQAGTEPKPKQGQGTYRIEKEDPSRDRAPAQASQAGTSTCQTAIGAPVFLIATIRGQVGEIG